MFLLPSTVKVQFSKFVGTSTYSPRKGILDKVSESIVWFKFE